MKTDRDAHSPRAVALMVTTLEGMEATAAAMAANLGIAVELAGGRAAAGRLLGRRSYSIVILDQLLANADPEGAELIAAQAGLAIPMQINFALAGTDRIEREVRNALTRREREMELAGAAAAEQLDAELKNAVTGMLLESQLALAEAGIPPEVENRLRTLAAMADDLRVRLAGRTDLSHGPVELSGIVN